MEQWVPDELLRQRLELGVRPCVRQDAARRTRGPVRGRGARVAPLWGRGEGAERGRSLCLSGLTDAVHFAPSPPVLIVLGVTYVRRRAGDPEDAKGAVSHHGARDNERVCQALHRIERPGSLWGHTHASRAALFETCSLLQSPPPRRSSHGALFCRVSQLPFKVFLTLINVLTFAGQYMYTWLFDQSQDECGVCVCPSAGDPTLSNRTAMAGGEEGLFTDLEWWHIVLMVVLVMCCCAGVGVKAR